MAPVFNHLAFFIAARVISDQLLTGIEPHAEWVSFEGDAPIGILDGNRIVIGLEAHSSCRMHQCFNDQRQLRCIRRERTQVPALKRQASGNRISLSGHGALLIRYATCYQLCIDRFQISALWKRHEVISARISDQIFDTALLPTGMPIGKQRFTALDTLEVYEHCVLTPAMSLQDLQHSRFEVIVDRKTRDASPELKGMPLTEQKGFLALGGEALDKHRTRKTEPPGQERHFDELAAQVDSGFPEVKLCSLTGCEVERHVGGLRRRSQSLNEETDGRFPDGDSKGMQFCPHAVCCPALFWSPTLHPLIFLQPFLDVWQGCIAHWRPGRCLTLILAFIGRWLLQKELSNRIQ